MIEFGICPLNNLTDISAFGIIALIGIFGIFFGYVAKIPLVVFMGGVISMFTMSYVFYCQATIAFIAELALFVLTFYLTSTGARGEYAS